MPMFQFVSGHRSKYRIANYSSQPSSLSQRKTVSDTIKFTWESQTTEDTNFLCHWRSSELNSLQCVPRFCILAFCTLSIPAFFHSTPVPFKLVSDLKHILVIYLYNLGFSFLLVLNNLYIALLVKLHAPCYAPTGEMLALPHFLPPTRPVNWYREFPQ